MSLTREEILAMPMETKAAQGISAEVLAPYLPFGILVQVKTGWGGGLDVMQGELVGLQLRESDPVTLEMVNAGGIKKFISYWAFADCLPVLRPFSQLCDPLPDGTVPAIEVALLVAGPTTNWRVFGQLPNLVELRSNSGHFIIKHIYHPEWGWHFGAFDRICGPQQPLNIGAAYDYLRSKHFALPVNGRPLVEGVDYIAPTPSQGQQTPQTPPPFSHS